MKRGTIRAVKAMGGLLQLVLETPEGDVITVYGDNGPTVRALSYVFGDHIIQGHSLLVDEIIGCDIEYSLTDWGTLEAIGEA